MLEKNAYLIIADSILSRPNISLSVRDIARLSNLSPASSSIHLRSMLEDGILKKSVIGRNHQYCANLENPIARQLKILFNLDKIFASNLLKECDSSLNNIMCILLYGSIAKGTDDEKSDVDILIITATKNNSAPDPSRFNLSKEVNVLIYSYDQWKSAYKTNKEFYSQVMDNCIELHGQKVHIS